MLLQSISSSPSQLKHPSLSSASLYSKTPPWFNNPSTLLLGKQRNKSNSITSYIPQVYSYSKAKNESRPTSNWNSIYRRIWLIKNRDHGASSILNQLEKEKYKFSRWELSRVARELRKFRRFKLALQVYEWMSERADRFIMSSSDAAFQLDLISKVHGVPSTEEFFAKLPGTLKRMRTYEALLSAYVLAKNIEKSESVLEEMKTKGYDIHPLPYNVMMTFYMKLKDYEKAESMISEMKERNIPLDISSYNIWLTICGATGSTEKLEEVVEEMEKNKVTSPDWSTYSTMATMYMSLGELKKARDNLRLVEGKVSGRGHKPFQYLLSIYAGIGEKEEVNRIWNTYKTSFPKIPNMGYHLMIASLCRLNDIEGALQIYTEWLPYRSSYDPRICNLIIRWYVQNELLEKAEDFLDQLLKDGGKANARTYQLLADGHIKKQQIPEALSLMKEATLAEGGKFWRPNPVHLSHSLSLCDKEGDTASKKAVMKVLKKSGYLEDEAYMSVVNSNGEMDFAVKLPLDKDGIGEDDLDSQADTLLDQFQGSL